MQVVDTGSAANGLMEIAFTAARISSSATLSSSMSYNWVVSVLARPRRGGRPQWTPHRRLSAGPRRAGPSEIHHPHVELRPAANRGMHAPGPHDPPGNQSRILVTDSTWMAVIVVG
jgi:hypothetical protein